MNTFRRFREHALVFAVFEFAGLVASGAVADQLDVTPSIADLIYRSIVFGIAGCVSWALFCRADSSAWLYAGLLTGVIVFPIAVAGYSVLLVFLMFPQFPMDILGGIVLSFSGVLIFGYITIPCGLSAAYVCRWILKRRLSNPAIKGTVA